MTRRQWMTVLAATLTTWRWPRWSVAQDTAYQRAVEGSFARFRDVGASHGRIAPLDEPGEPLRIRGTLYQPDGRTPLAGALVFAYHTDRMGLYNTAGAAHSWRLQGAVRTDARGGFEFETIRPASYPDTRIPQHVHVELATGNGRYHAGEWRFDDDPKVGADERARSARDGEFGWVRPVTRIGAVSAIEVKVRVKPESRF